MFLEHAKHKISHYNCVVIFFQAIDPVFVRIYAGSDLLAK